MTPIQNFGLAAPVGRALAEENFSSPDRRKPNPAHSDPGPGRRAHAGQSAIVNHPINDLGRDAFLDRVVAPRRYPPRIADRPE